MMALEVQVTKPKVLEKERARQVAAQLRQAQERRKRMAIAGAAVGAVVLLLGILVGVKLAGGGGQSGTPQSAAQQPASATVLAGVTAVPASLLDQVGVGQVNALPKTVSGQPVLTDQGKPLVLYVGAEYCPFCAAERWAVVMALSRFGTFTNLGQTHSASGDAYPNTATLSFHGARYTSQYLSFQGVETESNQLVGNGYAPLDTLTTSQQQIVTKYNAPPYVAASSAGTIPFIDFANQAVISGASYSPQLLAGMSADQIATALKDPTNPITQAVGGTANAITALLCRLTGNQPSAVCTSAAVTAFHGKL
jgi:hypothetical protein